MVLLYENLLYPDILGIITYIFSGHFRLALLIEVFSVFGLALWYIIWVRDIFLYGCSIFLLAFNKKAITSQWVVISFGLQPGSPRTPGEACEISTLPFHLTVSAMNHIFYCKGIFYILLSVTSEQFFFCYCKWKHFGYLSKLNFSTNHCSWLCQRKEYLHLFLK